MTEQEWLTSADPERMLRFIDPRNAKIAPVRSLVWNFVPSDRKLRLFAVACWRASGKFPKSAAMYAAVEAGETEYEGSSVLNPITLAIAWAGTEDPVRTAALLREVFGNPFRETCWVDPDKGWLLGPSYRTANNTASDVICVLPPAVLALAQAAYDERLPYGTLDPARLAVLADGLEEAGCREEELLRHLRQVGILCDKCKCSGKVRIQGDHGDWDTVWCDACHPNEMARIMGYEGPHSGWKVPPPIHVRGCWALDLILGKE